MGKHSKQRDSRKISPSDQREKIRDSILQVFRARLKSPGGGGALLVKKTHSKEEQAGCGKTALIKQPKICIMSDDESPSQSQKTKKRKTRSERNKLKSKQSETQTFKVNKPERLSSAVCAITQNRLTKRLGLFNQGKKSTTILRGPVEVPDSVKEKTKEDLRKILTISDSTPGLTIDLETISSRFKDNLCKNNRAPDSHCGHPTLPLSDCSNHKRDSNQNLAEVSMETDDDNNESAAVDGLDSVSIPDVAAYLMKGLKMGEVFLGRNLVQETKDDLYKLLKHNSGTPQLASLCTPKVNPSASSACGSALSSETVRRISQSEKIPCPQKQVTAPSRQVFSQETVTESRSNLAESYERMSPKSILQFNDMVATRRHHQQGGGVDGMPIADSAPDMKLTRRMDVDPPHYVSTIHTQQQHASKKPSWMQINPAFKSFNAQPIFQRPRETAVITEANPHPEYMPQFHDGHLSSLKAIALHTNPHVHPSSQPLSQQPVEAMDILDYLDHSSSAFHQRAAATYMDLTESGGMGCVKRVRSATPDSDGSPTWCAITRPSLPPFPKPRDSPSRSPKMYPRMLY